MLPRAATALAIWATVRGVQVWQRVCSSRDERAERGEFRPVVGHTISARSTACTSAPHANIRPFGALIAIILYHQFCRSTPAHGNLAQPAQPADARRYLCFAYTLILRPTSQRCNSQDGGRRQPRLAGARAPQSPPAEARLAVRHRTSSSNTAPITDLIGAGRSWCRLSVFVATTVAPGRVAGRGPLPGQGRVPRAVAGIQPPAITRSSSPSSSTAPTPADRLTNCYHTLNYSAHRQTPPRDTRSNQCPRNLPDRARNPPHPSPR